MVDPLIKRQILKQVIRIEIQKKKAASSKLC